MKAMFPNGYQFDITEDQAKKIKFIQRCIREQRKLENKKEIEL